MALNLEIPPNNLILEAIQELQIILEELPGMNPAPFDNPPKETSNFPFPVVIGATTLRWRSKPSQTKTNWPTITFEIHTGLQAKPRDLVKTHQHIEPIANALLLDPNGRNLNGTINGFVNPPGSDTFIIEGELDPDMAFLGVSTIGWVYTINVKQVYTVET